MKRLLLTSLLSLICLMTVMAQDSRYAGTWICLEEEYRSGEHCIWDRYIRIDIEDSNVYVRLKQINNIDGKISQHRGEGEHVIVNSDGSISFDEYLSKNEYDDDDHLYWTVWEHYVLRYKGGRLNVSQKLMGEGCNSNGRLVEDGKHRNPIKYMTYYNEKDNW